MPWAVRPPREDPCQQWLQLACGARVTVGLSQGKPSGWPGTGADLAATERSWWEWGQSDSTVAPWAVRDA